jgi:hypothetical protein
MRAALGGSGRNVSLPIPAKLPWTEILSEMAIASSPWSGGEARRSPAPGRLQGARTASSASLWSSASGPKTRLNLSPSRSVQ